MLYCCGGSIKKCLSSIKTRISLQNAQKKNCRTNSKSRKKWGRGGLAWPQHPGIAALGVCINGNTPGCDGLALGGKALSSLSCWMKVLKTASSPSQPSKAAQLSLKATTLTHWSTGRVAVLKWLPIYPCMQQEMESVHTWLEMVRDLYGEWCIIQERWWPWRQQRQWRGCQRP